MNRNEDGHLIVKSKSDIDKAIKAGDMFVYAICCKCGGGWTSIMGNAYEVVTKGGLCCSDKWMLKVGIIKDNTGS